MVGVITGVDLVLPPMLRACMSLSLLESPQRSLWADVPENTLEVKAQPGLVFMFFLE